LCLAITLEVTRAPVPDANVTSPGLEPKSLPAPPARQKLEKTNEPQVAPEQDQAETEAATQGYLLNKQLADEPTEEARANFNDAQLPRADAERVPASASMAFEVKDADMLRRAENQARLQSGNNKDDAVEEVTALAASIDSAATPEECSAEARAAPDSWLACIEALEAADDTEAALRQRDRLVEVFPDFKLP
jgi:hypothetical protein